jgi:hypothetical protein
MPMLRRVGRWRSCFGRKGELWYYTDPIPAKMADRPHKWTLVIGLFAPSIAVVALIVSLWTLHTNERSMKLGQRAYLAVTLDKITGLFPNRLAGLKDKYEVIIQTSVTVKNVGNTPAYRARFDFSTLVGAKVYFDATQVMEIVPAKSTIETRFNVVQRWDVSVFRSVFVDCLDCTFELSGRIVYQDVFGDRQSDAFTLVWNLNSLDTVAYEEITAVRLEVK